jgi:hypothetical protein
MTTHILGKDVEICAHDANETVLRHSILFDGWVIMNKHGLCLEYNRDFARAVMDLYHITGTQDFTFLGHTGE